MKSTFLNKPIFPIAPSYAEGGELCVSSNKSYVEFLESQGAKVIMTTEGTSQFNLLSLQEIRKLNLLLCQTFGGVKILGIPMLSTLHTIEEVKYYNENVKEKENVLLLLLYPERFYDNNTVTSFFHEIEAFSDFNLMIHGKKIRKATGGVKEYDADLLNHIISGTKKIVGIKEECSTFELGYDTIRNLPRDFTTIVAGKSIRRFEFLKKAGATTFLSGVGSFYPKFEIDYFSSNQKQQYLELENNFFDTFMSIGWHKSMRNALRIMGVACAQDRQPFPSCTNEEEKEIEKQLKKAREFVEKK